LPPSANGPSSRGRDGGEAGAAARNRHRHGHQPRPQQGVGRAAGQEPPPDPGAVAAPGLVPGPGGAGGGQEGGRGVLPLPQPPPGAPALHRGAARRPGGRSLPARSVSHPSLPPSIKAMPSDSGSVQIRHKLAPRAYQQVS